MTAWRPSVAVLLGAAAVGAIFRSANASSVGRAGGWLAAAVLAAVAVGVLRDRRWAYGAAFFLGVFWLWAAVALGIQSVLGSSEALAWIIWSVAVIVGSVRARQA